MIISRPTALALLVSSFLLQAIAQTSIQTSSRTPVLVELFTSEGCSSCPPADALLAKLGREQPVPSAQIIILEEHVDYWDSLGWRDRFSSHASTERQQVYGLHFHLPDVYTPQMVVAGRQEFNGSDAGAASRAIAQAARKPAIRLELTQVKLEGRHLSAKLIRPENLPGSGDLFAAVVAPAETTNVRAGENGGRTLRHAGVVLSLKKIGNLHEPPAAIELETPLGERALSLVVFAQETASGAILGAVSAPVPVSSSPAVASISR